MVIDLLTVRHRANLLVEALPFYDRDIRVQASSVLDRTTSLGRPSVSRRWALILARFCSSADMQTPPLVYAVSTSVATSGNLATSELGLLIRSRSV